MYDIIFKIQNGEKDLLKQFIIDNMDYIYLITNKYYDFFDDYEDLVHEAVIGFVKAVYNYNDKFDFYKQYAILWINNYIKRYILDNINLISDIDKRYFFAIDLYDRCKNKYKHEPTISELAHFANTKVDNAREIMNIINDPSYKSYNDHYDITDNNYYEDLCITKLETNNFKNNYIFNNLTKKQEELVLLKYGFKDKVYSSREIGKITGKTSQAVDYSLEFAKKRIKKKYLEHEQRFNK